VTRCSRFPVVARLRAGGPVEGTVLVERALSLVHVRAKRSRKLYTLTLAEVAEHIVHKNVLREIAEKRRAKAERRRARR
jgi:hypothetical protein